ncbi:hypothetical protein FHS95_000810 [Sphingomonas naasensis]|uniref:Polysaccharide lyase 14 domain-containing protein n=1 Tax=Sphingomonas naasensis TaxID=1344951 RepID=A0A4S1WVP4_9SPHN|nr:hypothetical protein [Sphingomonas naasensis]NIJ19141.1 hypothetical protein [Sphingomonas naasensis]TGX46330.1 hypothetical protein E5A74_04040 [Sphingomonas naasensis]
MKRPAAAVLALGVLTASAGGSHAPSKPVLAEDFESDRGAVYRILTRDPRLIVVAGAGVGGGRALRTTYAGGPTGSDGTAHEIPLGEAGGEYTLNYDVRFDRDFQFVRGGKMHGLGPAEPVTGGNGVRPDGWSARVMWRELGRPVTYTYHQDQRGTYGDDGPEARPFAFALDRYYAISLHVRLNDAADRREGSVRLYVDGVLVSAQEKIRLRGGSGEAGLISTFLFHTFHGGHDPSWAPRNAAGDYAEVHAWFDNIAVYRGERIRPRPGA